MAFHILFGAQRLKSRFCVFKENFGSDDVLEFLGNFRLIGVLYGNRQFRLIGVDQFPVFRFRRERGGIAAVRIEYGIGRIGRRFLLHADGIGKRFVGAFDDGIRGGIGIPIGRKCRGRAAAARSEKNGAKPRGNQSKQFFIFHGITPNGGDFRFQKRNCPSVFYL